MEIKRDVYLDKLIRKRGNGLIKVITGIRRCGKSYLLDPMFKNYLLNDGIPEDHIIKIELDRISNRKFYKDAEAFDKYVHSLIKDNEQYYLLLDEIQLVENFELVLNGFYTRRILMFMSQEVIQSSFLRILLRNSEAVGIRFI